MAANRNRGQIVQKGKDRFLVRLFLGRDPNGKRVYFTQVVDGSKSKAQKFLTAKLRERDLGVFVEVSRQTLNEHLDGWLEIKRTSVSPQTFSSYETLLRKHARPSLGKLSLNDIKQHQVQERYDSMTAKGSSARTVRYFHTVLNMAFQKAIEQNKIVRNPCEFVHLPKNCRSERKVMSPDQARTFLEIARRSPYGIIFEFAILTGMRPEEYLALRWEDLDLTNGICRVRRALVRNRKGGGFRFEEPKTKNSRRSIPIPETLCTRLRSHRREQLESRMAIGSAYADGELVFATDFGTPLCSRNLAQRYFAKIVADAGLGDGFVLYSLRHTCATLLLSAGENPKVVSERLGHTSVKMTLDTYSHVLPDMQRSASDKLDRMLYAS